MTQPDELTVTVQKDPVSGSCPECGAEELARYPVVSEKGWEMVTKCQACLYSVEREKWHRLGPISMLEDQLQ
jgi:uncharacterized Zn finger protein